MISYPGPYNKSFLSSSFCYFINDLSLMTWLFLLNDISKFRSASKTVNQEMKNRLTLLLEHFAPIMAKDILANSL